MSLAEPNELRSQGFGGFVEPSIVSSLDLTLDCIPALCELGAVAT